MMVERISRLTLLLAVLLLLVSQGCSRTAEPPVARAVRATLPLALTESGEIAAVRFQQVRAPQEWSSDLTVTAMVPEGTVVAAGDTVIQLDPSALDRELVALQDRLENLEAQRRGTVANQQSQRERLRNAVQMAELSRDQARLQLEKLQYEAESQREEARLRLSTALVSLDEARAKLAAQAILDSLELAKTDLELASARAAGEQLHERRAAMTIRAPIPGLVVYYESRDRQGNRSKPHVGETVDPWRPVVEIPDLSAMRVEFPVHEVDRHLITVGMPVSVRLEAYPETTFTGTIEDVARLATEVEDDSSVRGFVARAPLVGNDARLRPGMTAVVEIGLGAMDSVVTAPRTCVFELGGEAVVFPRAIWPEPRAVVLATVTPMTAAFGAGVADGEELVAAIPADRTDIQPLGFARHNEEFAP